MGNITVVGLDVGNGNVHACVLNEEVQNLKRFARSYKPIKLNSSKEDLEALAKLGDVFALEPTGAYYRVFLEFLQKAGKVVLLVPGGRIRHFAKTHDIINKKDREDAAVIAAYTRYFLHSPQNFISITATEIRELYLALASVNRVKNPIANQIWARLSYELPEFCRSCNGTKKVITPRKWNEPEPPAGWRWLSGETLKNPRWQKAYDEQLTETVGRGLSDITRSLAAQLCQLEKQEFQIEAQLQTILDKPELQPYIEVFESWHVPPVFQCVFLCGCFPINKYLDDQGKPIREWVEGQNGRSRRHRSLKAFQLSMGMGRIISESGKTKGKQVMGGPKYLRVALWQFVATLVVRRRGKQEEFLKLVQNLHKVYPCEKPWESKEICQAIADLKKTTPKLAGLMVYYEVAPNCLNVKLDQRISKVESRFVRGLFKDLIDKAMRKPLPTTEPQEDSKESVLL